MQTSAKRALAKIVFVASLASLMTVTVWGQSESVIHTFTGTIDGGYPAAGLIFDSKGNLFGTTFTGGSGGFAGTIIELTQNPDGKWIEKAIYSFSGFGSDGVNPGCALIFDGRGNLYGTTQGGGSDLAGTVFELSPSSGGTWTEKVLYNFAGGTDGSFPEAGLVFDAAGDLYGTTSAGGSNGSGTVFELVAGKGGTWSEKVLHTFTGNNDGGSPSSGTLVMDNGGHLYGATLAGGAHDYGVIYQLTPQSDGSWRENIVEAFPGGNGGFASFGGLAFDKSGNLFAAANYAVIELTPQPNGTWSQRNIHNFIGGTDGATAESGLTIDSAGNIYGTTFSGGLHRGTVFEMSPQADGTWTEKILHKFTGGIDGLTPQAASVTLDTQGDIFGVTSVGGVFNLGVVFEVKP